MKLIDINVYLASIGWYLNSMKKLQNSIYQWLYGMITTYYTAYYTVTLIE